MTEGLISSPNAVLFVTYLLSVNFLFLVYCVIYVFVFSITFIFFYVFSYFYMFYFIRFFSIIILSVSRYLFNTFHLLVYIFFQFPLFLLKLYMDGFPGLVQEGGRKERKRKDQTDSEENGSSDRGLRSGRGLKSWLSSWADGLQKTHHGSVQPRVCPPRPSSPLPPHSYHHYHHHISLLIAAVHSHPVTQSYTHTRHIASHL